MPAVSQTTIPFLEDDAGIEFGAMPAQRASESQRSKLVIASYNIRYAVGRYLIASGMLRKVGLNLPLHRREAVARNIAIAANTFSRAQLLPQPDVLALQEADKLTGRAGGHHVASELAARLDMSWVHVPAGTPRGVLPQKRQWWLNFEEQLAINEPGDTGIALLSRLPLEDVARIDLPWHDCPWRPRLALAATISLGSTRLRIFNAHIDPHPSLAGQLEQLEVIVDQADRSDIPTIVMGDFNTLSKTKCIETRRFFESRGYITPLPTGTATWRGAMLRFHADWIFVRDLRISRWGVARPLNVSDHWPIWAEVDLRR